MAFAMSRNPYQGAGGFIPAIDAMPPAKSMSGRARFLLGLFFILAAVASFFLVVGFGLIWPRP
jgi:hypothetical protein